MTSCPHKLDADLWLCVFNFEKNIDLNMQIEVYSWGFITHAEENTHTSEACLQNLT